MPNWNQVLKEIQREQRDPFHSIQAVKAKYITALFKKRKRNIITYYSGWLRKGNAHEMTINNNDKNSFMNAIHGMDRKLGLDLILHTPGGDIAATESLVYYLKKMFSNNIEVFVPQIAMSASIMASDYR